MLAQPAYDPNPLAAAQNDQNDDQQPVHQPPADLENGTHEEATAHSKGMNMWIVLLIFGVMCLTMVPGLLLGIITKQIPWGIAVSGAIATVASFFSGLYYYHNK